MKKIITYNLNGIRAAVGKGLLQWIKEVDPDIMCFQETKAQPEQIPVLDFEGMGYKNYWYSAVKKGYSGVGLITKKEPDNIIYGMGIKKYDDEGRTIRADFGDISVISVYHPSGSSGEERQAFKMIWLEDFLQYINELKKTRTKLIICGDFNICHKPIDIHDPKGNANNSGFLPEEREWITKFLESGFIDTFRVFNQEPKQYTWWSYRFNARSQNKGWRIDYNMATSNLAKILKSSKIIPEAIHSDHCPVLLEADF